MYHVRSALIAFAIMAITGCSMTPEQLKALDGAVCNHVDMVGFKNTTVAIGGASKPGNLTITPECAVTTK